MPSRSLDVCGYLPCANANKLSLRVPKIVADFNGFHTWNCVVAQPILRFIEIHMTNSARQSKTLKAKNVTRFKPSGFF